jgi:hypothetical protein
LDNQQALQVKYLGVFQARDSFLRKGYQSRRYIRKCDRSKKMGASKRSKSPEGDQRRWLPQEKRRKKGKLDSPKENNHAGKEYATHWKSRH